MSALKNRVRKLEAYSAPEIACFFSTVYEDRNGDTESFELNAFAAGKHFQSCRGETEDAFARRVTAAMKTLSSNIEVAK